ncbi:hypothetical protein [Umezawaea tangerina]|uniref:Uncharacterized protein n=1 Tax=Umezawaea tangerina TaxID=84725 RepID=A0A2T0TDA0_9PSEU|nr:hypothetical protein [Umezawaea tangerina]PRY43631.1 hypothetical protein CLV43_103378 [Umezawaea tangerina]
MRDRARRQFLTQVTAIVAAPVLLLGALALVCLHRGVLGAAGCGPLRIAGLAVFGVEEPEVVCTSIPFGADIPSWTLGLTSSVAVALYLVLASRLRNIEGDLVATGLLDSDELSKEPLRGHMAKMRKGLSVSIATQLLFFLPVLLLGVLFYVFVNGHNHMFADLPLIQGAGHVTQATESAYRESWWANWDRHPVLGVAWILIGSVGAYFAVKQGYLYWRLSKLFVKGAELAVLNYIPARLNRDHGWRPVGRVISLSYVAALNFLTSLIALLYMLKDPDAGLFRNLVLAGFAILGTGLNIRFVYSMISCVRQAHGKTVDIELNELNHSIERAGAVDAAVPLEIRGEQLASAPPYPIKGRILRSLSFAPGLVAATKLVHDAFGLIVT